MKLLDAVELALLLLAHGVMARLVRWRGPSADAVDVVLGIVSTSKLMTVPDIFDVDAAGHDVGSHQQIDLFRS